MIPVLLKLQAFLPFRESITLDFSSAREERLFLVAGNTGAGKTSVFDAICYALFGEVSGSERDATTLKSQFADDSVECFVEFTFENKGELYHIWRAPTQNKLRRNGNVSAEGAKAVLTLPNEEQLTKIAEVNHKIEEILGLTVDQFKKIVMLPQGEFRRFLSDNSNTKQTILGKIFGTAPLNYFTEQIQQKYNEVRHKLEDSKIECNSYSSQIEADNDSVLIALLAEPMRDYIKIVSATEAQIATKDTWLKSKNEELQALSKQLHRLDLETAQQFNLRLARYAKTKEEIQSLQEQSRQIDQTRLLVQQLIAVKSIQIHVQNRDNLLRSCNELTNKQKQYEKEQKELAITLAQCEQEQEKQQKNSETIPLLTQEISAIQEQLSLFSNRLELKNQLDKLSKSLTLIEQQQRYLTATTHMDSLSKHGVLLRDALNALTERDVLEQKATSCLSTYQDGYHRFLQAQAFFLSKRLIQNEPCPVCGGTDHPAPAQEPSVGAIEKDMLDSLSTQYESARAKVEKQRARCLEMKTKLTFSDEEFALNILTTKLDECREQYLVCKKECPKEIPALSDLSQEELEQKLHKLRAETEHQKATLLELEQQISSLSLTESDLQNQLKEKERLVQSYAGLLKNANLALTNARSAYERSSEAILQTTSRLKDAKHSYDLTKIAYQEALKESGIDEIEFPLLLTKLTSLPSLQQEIETYETSLASKQQFVQDNQEELEQKGPFDLDTMRAQMIELEKQHAIAQTEYESQLNLTQTNRRMITEMKRVLEKTQSLHEEYSQVAALYETASGTKRGRVGFERYVLGTYFDVVIESANLRLREMTDSRYSLRRRMEKEKGNAASGLELEVFDAYNGAFRHVNTLSGGESFKTALSLALGLADVITMQSGGIEINTVFIDEGFGTLDSQALENAIDCLYDLKNKGRIIGIISHVQTLQERIPVKLLVNQSKFGSTAEFVNGI